MAFHRKGALLIQSASATVAVCIACVASTGAAAQTAAPETVAAPEPEQSTAPDIIVTAQRRSEKALDVPASLTILDAGSINRGGTNTSLDLTYSVPGLKMDRNGDNTFPSIRGVSSLLSAPGLDPNVATYVDGVYISNPAAILDLPDVDNIVVLKGPQGTLFGRNATGGAIQITTKKPSFELGGAFSVTYGRFNDQTVRGYWNLPLIADTLAVSLTASEETADGYLRDVRLNQNVGGKTNKFVRGKILFRPSDAVSFTLTGRWGQQVEPTYQWGSPYNGITVAQAIPGAIIPRGPRNVATNLPAEFTQDKDYGFDLNGSIKTGAGTITLIGAYSNVDVVTVNSGYGAWVPTGGYNYFAHQKDRTHSFEADFTSDQFGPLNFVTGVYYYHNLGSYDPVQVHSDNPVFVATIFGYQTSDSYAAFVDGNYKLTDKLTLTAGVRYSYEKRSLTGQAGFGAFDKPPAPVDNFGNASFSAWTPRFALRYALTPKTNVYFSYSQGFKSGGYDASLVFGNAPPVDPVRPEKITAYEVGLKTSPIRGLDLSGSLYKYDYTDQQVSAFIQRNGVTLSRSLNAASSTIYGADFEASYRVTHGLSLHAAFSWIHARFDSFPTAIAFEPNYQLINGALAPVGNNGVQIDAKGNSLPRAPDTTFSFGAAYSKETDAGTFGLKVDYFRSGHYFFDAANLYKQPAYTNLDASLSWSPPKSNATLTIWGKNLTDTVLVAGTFITSSASIYYWAPPRTYGVTASFKF